MIFNDGLLMRTPAYEPLESPPHYILRLSEANGYPSPTVVMQLAVPGEDWRVPAKWDYAHLNTLLPRSRHTPPTFTYRWPTSTHRCDLSLLGHRILSHHMNATHAGVCPQCVNELGFAPAWWDFRYAIACPTHRRMFVFRCPSCGKRISLLRRGLLTCSCGAPFTQNADAQPSAALLWLMALLQCKAESPGLDVKSNPKAARPLRPEDASLGTLCTIIEAIARAEHRMTDGTAKRSIESQRRHLPAVASFLYEWPHGVFPFCSRWHDYKRATGPDDSRDLRTTFGWAFQALFENRHQKRRDTLFVIDAVLQYVSSALPGRAIDIRAKDLRQLPQERRAYCGLAKAAELSGIPLYTVVRMVRRKHIAYRVRYRGTRPIYAIETDVARKLRLDYQPALLFRQGSKRLGVTHALYRDLRRTGVLEKQHETMMPEAIAICDLDDFKQRVFAPAQQTASAEGLESLDRLRLSKCPRPAMVEILQGILQRTVRALYVGKAPQRINDLLVRPDEVEPVIARFAPARPPTLQELRTRYGLGGAEMCALARYLSGTPDSAGRVPPGAVDAAKLHDFMGHYIGLEAYSRAQHVGYRAALSHVQHDGTEILQMPSLRRKGGSVYFIPRRGDHAARQRSCPDTHAQTDLALRQHYKADKHGWHTYQEACETVTGDKCASGHKHPAQEVGDTGADVELGAIAGRIAAP